MSKSSFLFSENSFKKNHILYLFHGGNMFLSEYKLILIFKVFFSMHWLFPFIAFFILWGFFFFHMRGTSMGPFFFFMSEAFFKCLVILGLKDSNHFFYY